MGITQVVANKYDLVQHDGSSTTWLDGVHDWCLDNHCEYIRTAATHAPTDQNLAR